MKCLSCDAVLTDSESTLKYESGEFIDLCFTCLNESDVFFYSYEELENEDRTATK